MTTEVYTIINPNLRKHHSYTFLLTSTQEYHRIAR